MCMLIGSIRDVAESYEMGKILAKQGINSQYREKHSQFSFNDYKESLL